MPEPRPRDHLGRPLPRDAAAADIVATVPDRDSISSTQAWDEACAYLAAGRPFHAHEVFEQRWRCCPQAERDAWRALAQWGAALTHQARGNSVGARRLADRALAQLESCVAVPRPIDRERIFVSLREVMAATRGRL